jgi:hypothetical protein
VSAPPATALDLIWRIVRQARWNHPTSGFVADVLSCYFDRTVYYVAKVGEDALRVRIEEDMLDDFRRAFPEATLDEAYLPAGGLVFVRLPIPALVEAG